MVIMDFFLFVWCGIVQVFIEWMMDVAVLVVDSNVLNCLIVGWIMLVLIKFDVCCG